MSNPPSSLSLLFPGQGSQAVGMGGALAAQFPVAKAVFAEVDDALEQNLFAIMQDGPIDALTLTRNAQPALMATSIAAFYVLQEEAGLDLSMIKSMAGHSLGEYSAYCAAGAFTLRDTACLLRLRGEAMQMAVPVGEGGMAAILGLDMATITAALEGTGAEIANDNAPGQIVISGTLAAVETACVNAKEAGAKRALSLPVSAPFHSSHMAPAGRQMAEALGIVPILAPQVPIFSNVSAAPVTTPEEIRRTLTEQVTGRVRWNESITAMAQDGTQIFVEVGAGKVLTGMIKRIVKGTRTAVFGAPDDLAGYRDALSAE